MKLIYAFSTLLVILTLSCKKSEDPKPDYYLNKWVGKYAGISFHYTSYPIEVDSNWKIYYADSSFRNVTVDVSLGNFDSTLNFSILYNDSIVDNKTNLLFSEAGEYFLQEGSGSGYGYIRINLKSDSLYYHLFRKCGLPCQSGIDFKIRRQWL